MKMKNREIKFRAWNGRFMVTPQYGDWISFDGVPYTEASKRHNTPNIEIEKAKGYILMQYTGLKDKNGKEIYEGDVFRIEENSTEVDEVDRIFYVVIVWVQEWCMFCSLLAESEYVDYKNDGIKALDEPMFWTYTLEDTDSRKHFLCGNIYEHPHLVEKAKTDKV